MPVVRAIRKSHRKTVIRGSRGRWVQLGNGITKPRCSRSDGKRGAELRLELPGSRWKPLPSTTSHPFRLLLFFFWYGGLLEPPMVLQITHTFINRCKYLVLQNQKEHHCFLLMFWVPRTMRKVRVRESTMPVPSKGAHCTLFKVITGVSGWLRC